MTTSGTKEQSTEQYESVVMVIRRHGGGFSGWREGRGLGIGEGPAPLSELGRPAYRHVPVSLTQKVVQTHFSVLDVRSVSLNTSR